VARHFAGQRKVKWNRKSVRTHLTAISTTSLFMTEQSRAAPATIGGNLGWSVDRLRCRHSVYDVASNCGWCSGTIYRDSLSEMQWCCSHAVQCFIYKSLFTENTVASKKHSSASISTNKAKTTTKSITVVDTWYWSINKISYIINAVHQT